MSKGTPSSNTVQTQSGPPAQVLQNYQQVYNQAQNVAGQQYQPYSGPLVAGFTPEQQAGFANIDTAVNAGQPFLNQASNLTANAATVAQPYVNQAAKYTNNAATLLDPSNFGGTVAAYQSPYTQSVVDATQRQFNNTNAIQQNQLAGNAASAGAFGGDRQAVAQAVLAGQQQAQEAPTIAGLYNTGFQNATNAAQSNAWLNSQAGFGMANLGNELSQQNLAAGASFGNLGQQAVQEGLAGANAQLTAGGLQQQQAQQQLNVPYQAYLAGQGYPFQVTNWLEGLATGTGGLSGGVGSTTSPGPSGLSQAAGLGTAAVGALGASGAYGQNGWLANSFSSPSSSYNPQDLAATESTFSAGTGSYGGGNRGGRVGGFAVGGAIPIANAPNADVNMIPEGGSGPGLLGGGHNLLGSGNLMESSTGTTSTTTTPGNGDTTLGDIAKIGGIIAAYYYGGPSAGAGAVKASQTYHFGRGGGIDDFARNIGGLRPQRFDGGGEVSPGLSASVSGNPAMAQLVQSYGGLPTEQLQEMAARFPPNTSQGQMAQRALQMRHANPGSDPARPQVASTYATGGEPEDDVELPSPGPSVPGGFAAGFSPAPERLLSEHAVSMAKGNGYVPPPPELAPLVQQAALRHGVDPKPLAWLLSRESGWNPRAYNSASGTKGLGQFKDATAREVGIDPWDAPQAIDGAAAYLRKKLEQTGNYERAIEHYGTFSTGHGADADNAVRGQFRAFMQGASRGGIVSLADGGAIDDDYVDPSGLLIPGAHPASTPSPVAGLAPRVTANATSDTIPPPPTPSPSSNSPVAGFGSGEMNSRPVLKASPWEALLTAGLGMMAGTSPHAAVNIGQGGLAGVKDYQQQRQLAVQDQQRADLARTNAVWRAGQLANAAVRNQFYGQHVDDQGRGIDDKGRLTDAQAGLAGARAANIPVQSGINQQNANTRANLAGARSDYMKWQASHGDATAEEKAAQDAAIRDKWGVDQNISQQRVDNQGKAITLRETQGDARIAQNAQRLQSTNEFRQKSLELRARGLDDATVNNTMTNAARMAALNPSMTVGKAADQILAKRGQITPMTQKAPTAAPKTPMADPLGIR